MAEARECGDARARQNRDDADDGREHDAHAGAAEAEALCARKKQIDDADVLKAFGEERSHKDEAHGARENAAHAFEHGEGEVKRLARLAPDAKVDQEGEEPAEEHCGRHVHRDGLEDHLVEDQQKDDRQNREDRIESRRLFLIVALLREFIKVGNFARAVLAVEVVLHENVGDRHGEDGRHCHRELVLEEVFNRF